MSVGYGFILFCFIYLIFTLAFWAIIAAVMSNYAKKEGVYNKSIFLWTFFLGIFGIGISLWIISDEKKKMNWTNMQQQMYYQNMYGQNPYNPNMQNPYNNPNMQNPYNSANMGYSQTTYSQPQNGSGDVQLKTCVNCGNKQPDGKFCGICGGELR